ncbi:MAG: Fur family transcriptional regulator [Ktedonobacteraceae bacterium]
MGNMDETLNTNARAILGIVQTAENHPTASDVFEQVRMVRPRIGLATVYRVLHQLAEQGRIKELGRDVESCRYDAHTERHDHAICTECGALLDIPLDVHVSSEALEAAAQAAGVALASHEVRIYGLCAACQGKAKE